MMMMVVVVDDGGGWWWRWWRRMVVGFLGLWAPPGSGAPAMIRRCWWVWKPGLCSEALPAAAAPAALWNMFIYSFVHVPAPALRLCSHSDMNEYFRHTRCRNKRVMDSCGWGIRSGSVSALKASWSWSSTESYSVTIRQHFTKCSTWTSVIWFTPKSFHRTISKSCTVAAEAVWGRFHEKRKLFSSLCLAPWVKVLLSPGRKRRCFCNDVVKILWCFQKYYFHHINTETSVSSPRCSY